MAQEYQNDLEHLYDSPAIQKDATSSRSRHPTYFLTFCYIMMKYINSLICIFNHKGIGIKDAPPHGERPRFLYLLIMKNINSRGSAKQLAARESSWNHPRSTDRPRNFAG